MILDHEALNYYYKSLYRLSALCLTSVLMYHCQIHTGYNFLWKYTLLKLAMKSQYHLSYQKVSKCWYKYILWQRNMNGRAESVDQSPFVVYLLVLSAALKTDVKDEAQAAILWRLNKWSFSHWAEVHKESDFGKHHEVLFQPLTAHLQTFPEIEKKKFT